MIRARYLPRITCCTQVIALPLHAPLTSSLCFHFRATHQRCRLPSCLPDYVTIITVTRGNYLGVYDTIRYDSIRSPSLPASGTKAIDLERSNSKQAPEQAKEEVLEYSVSWTQFSAIATQFPRYRRLTYCGRCRLLSASAYILD
ncbi:hypothetical protein F4861DRAFT_38543 [Xylaria intraflava]|nr:hypothetical protein F4861DRAFT_38543 [Xylaria intraflava]